MARASQQRRRSKLIRPPVGMLLFACLASGALVASCDRDTIALLSGTSDETSGGGQGPHSGGDSQREHPNSGGAGTGTASGGTLVTETTRTGGRPSFGGSSGVASSGMASNGGYTASGGIRANGGSAGSGGNGGSGGSGGARRVETGGMAAFENCASFCASFARRCDPEKLDCSGGCIDDNGCAPPFPRCHATSFHCVACVEDRDCLIRGQKRCGPGYLCYDCLGDKDCPLNKQCVSVSDQWMCTP